MSARERYDFGELIGEGGFGKTHAATLRETGERVVIKELGLRELPDWKPVEHFEREARVLASLEHPGIPRFIEAFEDHHRFYIVSERIAGQTLGAQIASGRRWTGDEAVGLARALLEILAYLHGLLPPVIHRDIKPDNIVLRESGEPVLVDFGAVRDLALPGATGGATVLGTPGYMAPEQSLGRADARSDLYSLGATLAHVFTHRHPQQLLDVSMQIDAAALAPLPSGVRELLTSLTRVDPTARPESATASLAILDGQSSDGASGGRSDFESPRLALRDSGDQGDERGGLQPRDGESREPPQLGAGASVAGDDEPRGLRSRGEGLSRRRPGGSTALATLAEGERELAPVGGRTLTPAITREIKLRVMKPEQMTKVILPTVGAAMASAFALPLLGAAGLAVVIPAALLCGGLPIATIIRARKRARELFVHGVEVRGRVTSANNMQMGAFIDYEYEVDGEIHEGYTYTRDSLVLSSLERGAAIRVFLDPDDPSVSVGLVSA